MKMNNGIYILSLPIQSGKTTLLQNWLPYQHSIAGFLAPDINGMRHLLDITTGNIVRFQMDASDTGIHIGRFVFDPDVFSLGRKLLLDACNAEAEWVIVDEIGRLEINRQLGWEPAITQVIDHFKNKNPPGKLLLVIRDYLLEEAIANYGLQHAKILSPVFFEKAQEHRFSGLVLCGGESSRMGTDKALLHYHNHPQFVHVAELLQSFCDEVLISSNRELPLAVLPQPILIRDALQYLDTGPMGGVLSAFDRGADRPLFVLGCDYPLLTRYDLLPVFNAFSHGEDAVCYQHPDTKLLEPLIAIYAPSSFQKMKSAFDKGHLSLRKLLESVRTRTLVPQNADVLRSFDTPEDFVSFRKQ